MKTCSVCGETKPLDAFTRQKLGKDGHRANCRECCKTYNAGYRARKADAIKAYNARYRDEHREDLRAKGRAYMKARYWAKGEAGKRHREKQERARRKRDPERVKATKIAWKKNNPEAVKRHKRTEYERHHEKIKARVARWAKEKPEMRRAQTLKRRSLQANAAGADYTTAQHIAWRKELYGGRCYYCGADADTIDHRISLVNGGSHWPANLVPCCRSCNSAKNYRNELEYRRAA